MNTLYAGMTRKTRKKLKMELKKNEGKIVDASVRGCIKLEKELKDLYKEFRSTLSDRFIRRAKRYERIYAEQ